MTLLDFHLPRERLGENEPSICCEYRTLSPSQPRPAQQDTLTPSLNTRKCRSPMQTLKRRNKP